MHYHMLDKHGQGIATFDNMKNENDLRLGRLQVVPAGGGRDDVFVPAGLIVVYQEGADSDGHVPTLRGRDAPAYKPG